MLYVVRLNLWLSFGRGCYVGSYRNSTVIGFWENHNVGFEFDEIDWCYSSEYTQRVHIK